MKKRICPICDQEMHSAHYCSSCKSWVKEPYIREANYYLNERHPGEEVNCSYHNEMDQVPVGRKVLDMGKTLVKPQPEGSFNSSWKPAASASRGEKPSVQPVSNNEKKRPRSSLRWILWLFLFIYVILPLLGTLFGTLTFF